MKRSFKKENINELKMNNLLNDLKVNIQKPNGFTNQQMIMLSTAILFLINSDKGKEFEKIFKKGPEEMIKHFGFNEALNIYKNIHKKIKG